MILMALVSVFMLIFVLLAGSAALVVLVAAASAIGGAALAGGDAVVREVSGRRARRNGVEARSEFEWARPTAMADYSPCPDFDGQAPRPAYAGRWVFDPLKIEAPVLVDDAYFEAQLTVPTTVDSEEEPAADSHEDLGAYILTR